MDLSTVDQQIRILDSLNEIAYMKVSSSNLGGTTSYFLHISLDKKEDWVNNIFHNSRYAIFALQSGKIELIAKHYQMPKFRKCNIKSAAQVAEKIASYCINN